MKNSSVIELDCNATTKVLKVAQDAALSMMCEISENPSSIHSGGLLANAKKEDARQLAADVLGVEPQNLTFTSGATESTQTAVFSALINFRDNGYTGKILYGATEHKVVPESIFHWTKVFGLKNDMIGLPLIQ